MWEIVENEYVELENDGGASQTKSDTLRDSRKRGKTLYLIFQRLDDDAFEKVLETKTTKPAWENLQTLYNGADPYKKKTKGASSNSKS